MLAAPLGGLAFLFLVGAGPAAILAPRFSGCPGGARAGRRSGARRVCERPASARRAGEAARCRRCRCSGAAVGVAARRRTGAVLRAAAIPLAIGVAAIAARRPPGPRPRRLARRHALRQHGLVPLGLPGARVPRRARAGAGRGAPRPADLRALEGPALGGRAAVRAAPARLAVAGRPGRGRTAASRRCLAALLPLAAFAVARGAFEWRPAVARRRGARPCGQRGPALRDLLLLAAAGRRGRARLLGRGDAAARTASRTRRDRSCCSPRCSPRPRSLPTGSASAPYLLVLLAATALAYAVRHRHELKAHPPRARTVRRRRADPRLALARRARQRPARFRLFGRLLDCVQGGVPGGPAR